MPWSIGPRRVNYFQTKTELAPASAAAMKAHREDWSARLAQIAKENGNRIIGPRCGTLSGYGIPRPACSIEIKLRSAPRDTPNVMSFPAGYLVTKAIRDTIEAHDPDVHGFWPVQMKWRSGEAVSQQYWLLNIGQRLETIDDDRSETRAMRNDSGFVHERLCMFEKARLPGIGDKEAAIRKNPIPVVLNRDAIGDAALWTEAHFGYKSPVANLMSDALYEDLKAVGMSIWAPECYLCAD